MSASIAVSKDHPNAPQYPLPTYQPDRRGRGGSAGADFRSAIGGSNDARFAYKGWSIYMPAVLRSTGLVAATFN
jgi:hypothetical protein